MNTCFPFALHFSNGINFHNYKKTELSANLFFYPLSREYVKQIVICTKLEAFLELNLQDELKPYSTDIVLSIERYQIPYHHWINQGRTIANSRNLHPEISLLFDIPKTFKPNVRHMEFENDIWR